MEDIKGNITTTVMRSSQNKFFKISGLPGNIFTSSYIVLFTLSGAIPLF